MGDFEIEKQLVEYLEKNYVVKEFRFFSKHNDEQEWGRNISNSLSTIFSYNLELCEDIFKHWGYSKYLTAEQYSLAWCSGKLRTTWSPEFATDISVFHNIDAEAELTAILSEQIAAEINASILNELIIEKQDDLLGVIKCVGYELGPTIYDPETFTPLKYFKATSYRDMMNERENNTIWQNWIRTRK